MPAETDSIAGMTPSGRRIPASALDLVELVASNGLKHLALVFHDRWKGHPLISGDLQERIGFMEQPQASGVARLVAHEPETGTFVYPSGTVWTVSEIVRTFADNGTVAGVKAGLELCYLVGEALVDAQEAAQGLGGHGSINPWTLVVKGDAQPLVLGYGLPQIELIAWREDNRIPLVEDSLRYAPPERIEGHGEDISSDLFSLALVALELMVGRPVYDGVLADVKQQATRAEGMRRLYQWREKLPQNVREVLGRALKPDPDTRFPNGLEFVYAVHDLLGSIDVEGPSLTEVMAKIRASQKRGRALKGGNTSLLSPEEMAEMAADLGEFEDKQLKPPRRPRPEAAEEAADGAEKPRWQKVVRQSTAQSNASDSGDSADTRRRRVREGRGATLDTPAPVRGTLGAAPPPRESTMMGIEAGSDSARTPTRERLVRRLREEPRVSSPDDLDPADVVPSHTGRVEPPIEPAPDDSGARAKTAAAALLERLRTSGDRRRRLRTSTTDGDPSIATLGVHGTAATAGPPSDPAPPAVQNTAADSGRTAPSSAQRTVPPPPPMVRSVTPGEPSTAQKAAAVGPAEPLVRHTLEVRVGKRTARVLWQPEERPAALVVRVVSELGGWPIEPTGRLLGGFRATMGGAAMDPDAPVSSGITVTLEFVPAETRLVEIVVRGAPDIRFQSPISICTPVSWLVAGLGAWLKLPAGDRVLAVNGVVVDGDRLLIDVLGDATQVTVEPSGQS